MIQRIQTIYLFIVALVSGALIFFVPLWLKNSEKVIIFDLISNDSLLLKSLPILYIVSSIVAIIAILQFKNRKLQFVINRINILINLFLLGVSIYYLLSLSGETGVSEKGIGVFLPILNVLLLVLANKAIQKDENLVKSVDRLR